MLFTVKTLQDFGVYRYLELKLESKIKRQSETINYWILWFINKYFTKL